MDRTSYPSWAGAWAEPASAARRRGRRASWPPRPWRGRPLPSLAPRLRHGLRLRPWPWLRRGPARRPSPWLPALSAPRGPWPRGLSPRLRPWPALPPRPSPRQAWLRPRPLPCFGSRLRVRGLGSRGCGLLLGGLCGGSLLLGRLGLGLGLGLGFGLQIPGPLGRDRRAASGAAAGVGHVALWIGRRRLHLLNLGHLVGAGLRFGLCGLPWRSSRPWSSATARSPR